MVKIFKYKKSTIDHAIYFKVFTDGTVSYIIVSTDDVINITNDEKAFPELTIFLKENLDMKVQEGSVLKYLKFRIFQYTLGFSVDNTDHIMELINEWSPTGKFREVDKTFRTESAYEKKLMSALTLIGHALHKSEMEYNGKFGHTLGRIQNISLMSIIELCYATCCLANQNVAPTHPGFQVIKRCVQYLASHPHKHIFYPYNSYDGSNIIRLTCSGNKFEDHTTQNCLEFHQDADHARILNRRRSVSGIIHTLLDVAAFWKVHIQPAIASDSTDAEIRSMYKYIKEKKLSGDTWKPYQSTLFHLQYIGKITPFVFMLLKLRELLLHLNILILLYIFYKRNLKMVSLFQNMRSPVSCRQICAPNHVQVQ